MSIIVLQHTVADNFAVDPNYNAAVNGNFLAGALVGLNSAAYAYPASSSVLPLGIAGDSIADSYKTGAYSAQLVISPSGKTRWTQDRIDNYFDETAASGMLTVYTTGGRFGTDQYVVGGNYAPGATLYTNATGQFCVAGSPGYVSSRSVGFVLAAPGGWESGVPGADAVNGLPNINGSMALGPYLFVQLSI